MALHGKTKIELTDVKTGDVETIVKDNFITNAVEAYDTPPNGLFDPGALLYGTNITTFFGSLAIFDKPIDGDENTFFPVGGVSQIGAAEYNVTNATTDKWLGSCNKNESSIDYKNKTATFVYDFTTAQANGEIGSVCLCPADCGRTGAFGVTGGFKSSCYSLVHYFSNDNTANGTMRTVSFNPYTAQYNAKSNKIYPILYDFENDLAWFWNASTSPVTIEKRNIGLHKVSLFNDQNYTNSTLIESFELQSPSLGKYWCNNSYQMYDNTHWCVFQYTETNQTEGQYAGTIHMIVYDFTGKIYKTVTVTSPSVLIRPSAWSVGYLNGKILMCGMTKNSEDGVKYAYMASEANPTDIQAAEFCDDFPKQESYFYGMPLKFSQGDKFYFYSGETEYITKGYLGVWDTETNKITATRAYIEESLSANGYTDYKYKCVPTTNPFYHILTAASDTGRTAPSTNRLFRFRAFLSTINNLDEIVTKTSDKTMKITYTIQESDETGV